MEQLFAKANYTLYFFPSALNKVVLFQSIRRNCITITTFPRLALTLIPFLLLWLNSALLPDSIYSVQVL
jgi:hypothetical protein